MRSLTSFLVEWVLATIVAALWCTVGSYAYAAVWCGKGTCWAFIGAVWLYACFAMLLYPAVVTLSQVAVSSCGKAARERLEGALALITAALTICISISMSTPIYYSVREINLSVLNSHGVTVANQANASAGNASAGNSSIVRDYLSVTDTRPGRRQLVDPNHQHNHDPNHKGPGSNEGHDWRPSPPAAPPGQDGERLSDIRSPPPPMARGTQPSYDGPVYALDCDHKSDDHKEPAKCAFPPPPSPDGGRGTCWYTQLPQLLQQYDHRRGTPGSGAVGANIGSLPCESHALESEIHATTIPTSTPTHTEDDMDALVSGGGIVGDDDIGGGAVAANSNSSSGSRSRPPLSTGYALLVPALVILLAATFTLWAALLTSVTARRLALHESGQRPIRSAYHRTLLICVSGAMASPVGYAWNAALSNLMFAPLLTVKTQPAAAVLLNLEIARAIFFVAFVGGLYLLFLRRVNEQLRNRHDIWARVLVLLHDGACAIVASGLANVVDYFCNFFLFGMWRNRSASLGLDFGIAIVVVGAGAVIEASGCLVGPAAASDADGAARHAQKKSAGRPSHAGPGGGASRGRRARCSLPPWRAFALNVARWLGSYCVWYPTTDALTYINGYDEANSDGLLATVGYAVFATLALVAAAVLTTSRAQLLAHHEASMRHVQLTEHDEPGTAPGRAGASGKPKPNRRAMSSAQEV